MSDTEATPHYYLMQKKIILRLEDEVDKHLHKALIKKFIFEDAKNLVLNQDQANYRVAIFRDEIMEWDEFFSRFIAQ